MKRIDGTHALLTGGSRGLGPIIARALLRQGGRVIAVEEATDFVADLFRLDVKDATAPLADSEFYIPGSILRLELEPGTDVTEGMRSEVAAWYWQGSRAFDVRDARVKVLARYGSDDPLLSGWAIGGQSIAGKPAILEADLGPGSVVLFGFQPNYRAQSMATWPLLFNAIRK